MNELWSTAEFIKDQSSVIQLLGGNFCVANVDRAYNIEVCISGDLLYKCDCYKYKALDGLCAHVLVTADKNGCLANLLDRYHSFGGNINKIMSNCAPKRAGEKCHNKKPRKGKNNVTSLPITQVNTVVEPLDQLFLCASIYCNINYGVSLFCLFSSVLFFTIYD